MKKQRLIDANKLFPYGSVPFYQDDGFRTAERIYEIIKKQPTVDAVEVVYGRWKVSRESEISRNVWCTACGKDFYMHRKGELQIDKMPYCPNCGAKMDGDGNGQM